MVKFVKLTTNGDGGYLRLWVDATQIKSISQLSGSQDGENQGTCTFVDGTVIQLYAFNETLDSLK